MSWIQTYTGKRFDLLPAKAEQVDIRDVAHALSRLCRFCGHTQAFYSVAQHSVLVSRIVPAQFALHGLLHDAAEAYVGDVTRPVKSMLGDAFAGIEDAVSQAISQKFGLQWSNEAEAAVKLADETALATEARDCLGTAVELWSNRLPAPLVERVIPYLTCEEAERAFRARFSELHRKPTVPPRGTAGATPIDDERLSKVAHEIRLRLRNPTLTRDQNVAIKQEVCGLYAGEYLAPHEASALQRLIAENFRRLDGIEKGAPGK